MLTFIGPFLRNPTDVRWLGATRGTQTPAVSGVCLRFMSETKTTEILNCQETCEEPLEGGAGAGEGGEGHRVPGAQHRHQPGGVAGHRDAARTPAGQQWSQLSYTSTLGM